MLKKTVWRLLERLNDNIYSAIEEYREKETYSEAISFEKADGLFLFKANIKYYDMIFSGVIKHEALRYAHAFCSLLRILHKSATAFNIFTALQRIYYK